MQTSIDDVAHTTPIYSLTEAAQIVRAPSTSFARWSHGHRFRQRAADAWGWSEPILTGVSDGRGYTVPFNALAEGYVVETFRRAGLPMARIRPAIDALRKEIGVEYALLSERLRTDGAEILIENGDRELVVVRNGQGVFRDVVAEFLQTISYRDGFVDFLRLPAYERAEVVVDPRRNSGRPTIARIGVTVEDVVSRVRAGERMRDVASDFALEDDELRSILVQAA
ncbi:DUF433 domain-containing protein [Curtobacterium citreum]|uniref:DUF433 domain-containing protein n=1 Tax=Curtobacterium citreum TaxID=2036 RepID=A0A850DW04_9MICO|nr:MULTISPECIES: DUF433 domain-containing protein [Curtobacterium]MDK8172339.1 DUF433 domain-containing protein [Curtobacterium citreum]NUU27742.1 DUF433 domain-containing protein [Curtobacterium albidum]WIJ44761.1 DUF433 domain-containing protein [Curtobacterium citreum]